MSRRSRDERLLIKKGVTMNVVHISGIDRLKRIAAVTCAMAALTACSGGSAETAEDQESVGERASTLLEIDVKDAHLRFVETEPGFVIVFSETRHGVTNPLADAKVREMNFIDMYEHQSDPLSDLSDTERRRPVPTLQRLRNWFRRWTR